MYVRICLSEQHLLPQGRPLVDQTHELGVHHAQELLDRLLLVTAPPQPRQGKRHGLQLFESQPVLLVEPRCCQGSLHPKSSICICSCAMPAEASRVTVSWTISVGPAR